MDYFNQGDTGSRLGGVEPFPDPFFDMASLAMPRTMAASLRWGEFIMSSHGIYRAAIERIISYFVTDIQVSGESLSDDEKRDFREYLVDDLGVLEAVYVSGMDEACYGNSFVSVVESFNRSLACGRCRVEFAFDVVTSNPAFRHSWANYEVHAHCPRCRAAGPWRMIDRRGGPDGELRIKHWSPHEIQIRHEPFGGRNAYIWVIPEDYRQMIRSGNMHAIRHAPREVIDAVRKNQNILFDEDYLYHAATRTFSGVRSRGWGIGQVLTNFRQAWYVQVLHRFNEAIAMDYVVPMRVITPEPAGGGSGEPNDPLLKLNMGGVGADVEEMIRQHRRDPGGVRFFPFALKYQQLGGEASQLVPHQLMDQGIDALLNSCNIPVELYKMTLSMQAAPPALRLFESTHRDKPKSFNRLLKFLIGRVSRYKDWPNASAELVPVTVIDDLSKQMPKLQLMQSGMVSPQTGLSTIGLDFEEETRKSLDAQRFQQEIAEEIQEEMAEAGMQKALAMPPLAQWQQEQQMAQMGGDPGMGGGMPPGGDPGAAGGAAANFAAMQPMPDAMPTSPQEVLDRAQTIASQLLAMPSGQKSQALKRLREQSPLLHDAVRSAMDDMRSQAESQGRDMVLQQQFGKTGAARIRRGVLGHALAE